MSTIADTTLTVLAPTPAAAPRAICPISPLVQMGINASLLGLAYFFLAGLGLSNIFDKDTSSGFALIMVLAATSMLSFAFVCFQGFIKTPDVTLITAFKKPAMTPITIFNIPAASSFYIGGYLSAKYLFNLSTLTAELIGAYCGISRYLLLNRTPILLTRLASKWPQIFRERNIPEILKIAYAFTIAILGSAIALDSYYTAPQHLLVDYGGFAKDSLTTKTVSSVWAGASAIGFLPFYLFWALFTLNLILQQRKTFCALALSVIIAIGMFAAPVIGSATSDSTPVYSLIMNLTQTQIFKLIAATLVTLAGTLIGAMAVQEFLAKKLHCKTRSADHAAIAPALADKPPFTANATDPSPVIIPTNSAIAATT